MFDFVVNFLQNSFKLCPCLTLRVEYWSILIIEIVQSNVPQFYNLWIPLPTNCLRYDSVSFYIGQYLKQSRNNMLTAWHEFHIILRLICCKSFSAILQTFLIISNQKQGTEFFLSTELCAIFFFWQISKRWNGTTLQGLGDKMTGTQY